MYRMIKNTAKILLLNWRTLLWFGIFYQALGYLMLFPVLQTLLEKVLAMAGVLYLGQDNFLSVLRQPAAIFLGVLMLAIFAGYVYYEIAALMLYCETGWQGRRLRLRTLLKDAGRHTLRLLRLRNLPVFILLLPVIAFASLPLTSGALQSFRVPEFIVDFFHAHTLLFIFYLCLLVLINLLLFFYLFGIPEFFLRNKDLVGSWRASLGLLRGRKLRVGASLTGFLLLLGFVLLILTAAGILLLYACAILFHSGESAVFAFRNYYTTWSRITFTISGGVVSACLSAAVLVLYHRLRGDTAPPAPKIPVTASTRIRNLAAIFCLLFFLLLYSESEISGNLFYPQTFSAEIIAHRAGAALAPENTLAALDTALYFQADAVEIDVQQTRDGVLIVMHDASFKRTAGVNKYVWETDYQEVETFEAGSFYSPAFAGEPIPTLEQMLLAAKGKIRLMIELKSTGHEQDLEQSTVDLISACGMEKQCMIVSMNPKILKKVKELAPEIQTAYISSILYSKFYNLDYLDAYSVETSNLTYRMAAQVHGQGKKIYAWTTNSMATMRRIFYCRADGLVTDDPQLARYCMEIGGGSLLLEYLTEQLFPGKDQPGRAARWFVPGGLAKK